MLTLRARMHLHLQKQHHASRFLFGYRAIAFVTNSRELSCLTTGASSLGHWAKSPLFSPTHFPECQDVTHRWSGEGLPSQMMQENMKD
jgi:hypothetical protein